MQFPSDLLEAVAFLTGSRIPKDVEPIDVFEKKDVVAHWGSMRKAWQISKALLF